MYAWLDNTSYTMVCVLQSTASTKSQAPPPTKSGESQATEKSQLDLLTERVKQQREKYDEEIAKSQKITPRRERGSSTLSLPDFPKFSAPELPKFSAPDLPKFSPPDMPKFSAPDLPKFSAPELPKSLQPGDGTKPKEPSSKTEAPSSKSVPQTAPQKPPVLAPLPKDVPIVPRPFVEKKKIEPEKPSAKVEALKSGTVPGPKDTRPVDKAQTSDSVLDMIRKKYSGDQTQPSLPQPAPVRPAAPAPAPSVVRPTPVVPAVPRDVVPARKTKTETYLVTQKRKGPLPLWLTQLLMLSVFGGLIYSLTALFDTTSKAIGNAYKATDRFLLGLKFTYNRTKSDKSD